MSSVTHDLAAAVRCINVLLNYLGRQKYVKLDDQGRLIHFQWRDRDFDAYRINMKTGAVSIDVFKPKLKEEFLSDNDALAFLTRILEGLQGDALKKAKEDVIHDLAKKKLDDVLALGLLANS